MAQATHQKTALSLKIGLAAVAAVGLSLTGFSPAFGATVNVGASDVAPIEVGGDGSDPDYNYDQWHIGSPIAAAVPAFDFDDPAGITLYPNSVTGTTESTQLFKGRHITNISSDYLDDMNAEAFTEFLNGVSTNVASGTVNLQIAGMFDFDGDGNRNWTTLRPIAAHGGAVATNPALGNWTGTGVYAIGGAQELNLPLTDILADMATDNGTFQLYGVGVVADNGDAVVASITFSGTTYNFAAAVNAPTPPTAVETAAK